MNGWIHRWWVFPFLLIFLAGCGGGGGGGTGNPTAEYSGGGTINGTVTKGPVSGATVTAYMIQADGSRGGEIGSAQTDSQGNFTMNLAEHSGPMMLQAAGGSYMDEATGAAMEMASSDVLTCAIPSMSAGSDMSGIQITPLTSMAQTMARNMAGGMTAANMAQANQAVGRYFGVSDILMTRPMNALENGSGAAASQDMRNYGMSLAAMSQYAANMGMSSSSAVATSMMNDAADGHLNGMMGSSQITMGGMMGSGMMGTGGMMNSTSTGTMMPAGAGSRGLAEAMNQFMSSNMNRSGLTVQEMHELMNQLMNSNGQIQ